MEVLNQKDDKNDKAIEQPIWIRNQF